MTHGAENASYRPRPRLRRVPWTHYYLNPVAPLRSLSFWPNLLSQQKLECLWYMAQEAIVPTMFLLEVTFFISPQSGVQECAHAFFNPPTWR